MRKICYVTTISISIKSFFLEQLKYLAENDFDVYVICSYDINLESVLGKNIHYIPINIPRGISIHGTLKAINLLRVCFEKEKFDIVQYSTPNAAFCAAIAAKKAGIKIRNYHLMGLRFMGSQGLMRFFLKQIEKITCNLSTHIECVSKSILKTAYDYGMFHKDVATVIWNGSSGGVDLKRFDINKKLHWRKLIRTKYKISDDIVVYGFAGRITKDKGIDELFSSFSILQKMHENVLLMLVGNFERENLLNQKYLSWARGNSKILFVNFANDIEKYYAAMDVIVLPSYREGFGNVIVEAEAMGIPVIVSNIAGPIDAMEEYKTGLTIMQKDRYSLLKAMEQMLDDDVREEYSNNAVIFSKENFDSEILCDKILQQKKKLLKQNNILYKNYKIN